MPLLVPYGAPLEPASPQHASNQSHLSADPAASYSGDETAPISGPSRVTIGVVVAILGTIVLLALGGLWHYHHRRRRASRTRPRSVDVEGRASPASFGTGLGMAKDEKYFGQGHGQKTMKGRADGTIELGELSLAQALQVTIAAPPRVPPKDEHSGETQRLSLKLHLRQDFALECEAFVPNTPSQPNTHDKALPLPPLPPKSTESPKSSNSTGDDEEEKEEMADTPETPSLFSSTSLSGAILQICATPSPGKSTPGNSPSVAASTPASSCVRFAAATRSVAVDGEAGEAEAKSGQDQTARRSSLTRAIARVGSLSASVSAARVRGRGGARGHTSCSEGHLTDLYSTPLRRPSTSAARLKSPSTSSLLRSPGRPGTSGAFRPGTGIGMRAAHSTGSVARIRPKTARSIRLVGADGSTSPPPPSLASFPTPTIGQEAQGFSMGPYDPLGVHGSGSGSVSAGAGAGAWSPSLSHTDTPVLPSGAAGMCVLGDLGARGLITIAENGLSTPAGLACDVVDGGCSGLQRARSVAFSPHPSLSPCSPALGTPLTPLGSLDRDRQSGSGTDRSMRIRGRCQTPGGKRALSLHEELGLNDDGVDGDGNGEAEAEAEAPSMALGLGFSASVQQVPGHAGLSQGLMDLGESLKRLGGGGRGRVFSGGSEGPMIPLPDLPPRSFV